MDKKMIKQKKRILYIASGPYNYSRVVLFRDILVSNFETTVICSESSHFAVRFVDVAIKFIWRYFRGLNKEYDVVLVGYMSQPLLPLIRYLCKITLISDNFFSLYDTLCFDKKYFSKNSLVGKLAYWLDKFSIEKSDVVICDTYEHIEYFKKFTKRNDVVFYRVLIGAQEKVFKYSKYPNRESKLIVSFHGLFIPLQGVEIIVKAAKLLQKENFPVFFNIIGKGQTYEKSYSLYKKYKLRNMVFRGLLPINEVSNILKSSHVGLGVFGSSDKTKRVIPNKVFEILSANRLLITGDTKAIHGLLKNNKNALLCKTDDPTALANKIKWAYKNFDLLGDIAVSGYKIFKKEASLKSLSAQINKVIMNK